MTMLKNNWILYFKRVNFIISEIYLNKFSFFNGNLRAKEWKKILKLICNYCFVVLILSSWVFTYINALNWDFWPGERRYGGKIGEGKQKSHINFLALNWKFKFELLKKCPSAVCFKGLEKTWMINSVTVDTLSICGGFFSTIFHISIKWTMNHWRKVGCQVWGRKYKNESGTFCHCIK